MASRVFHLQDKANTTEITNLIQTKRQITYLIEELRPLSSVIRHLIDDPRIGAEVTHYLQDVDDKLSNVQNKLKALSAECASVWAEHNTYQDKSQADLLFILTTITFVILPSQFLTSYFGMNFMRSDGTQGDPMLRTGEAGIY